MNKNILSVVLSVLLLSLISSFLSKSKYKKSVNAVICLTLIMVLFNAFIPLFNFDFTNFEESLNYDYGDLVSSEIFYKAQIKTYLSALKIKSSDYDNISVEITNENGVSKIKNIKIILRDGIKDDSNFINIIDDIKSLLKSAYGLDEGDITVESC